MKLFCEFACLQERWSDQYSQVSKVIGGTDLYKTWFFLIEKKLHTLRRKLQYRHPPISDCIQKCVSTLQLYLKNFLDSMQPCREIIHTTVTCVYKVQSYPLSFQFGNWVERSIVWL